MDFPTKKNDKEPREVPDLEYDPNDLAYEREMDSRLARERDREWRESMDGLYKTLDEIEATVKRIKRFLGVL